MTAVGTGTSGITAAVNNGATVLFDGTYTVEVADGVAVLKNGNTVLASTELASDSGSISFDGVTFTISSVTSGSATFVVESGFHSSVAGSNDSLVFQIGANSHQTTDMSIGDMSAKALGLKNFNGESLSVATRAAAEKWIGILDKAIEKVSSQRAVLGAKQNRLESTITSLQISEQNIQAAESRIRDADMAAEMMQFTRLNILQQTGTAMLANANAAPQSVLSLF